VLGYIDEALEESIASALDSTPQYSRLKYVPLKLAKCRR